MWGKAISGPNYEVGNALTVDGSGNVYITGFFRSSVDFDPGSGSSFLTSAGWSDIFICKLTSTGTLSWAKRIGDINYEEGKAITADASGNIYITGYFMNAPDFDPGTGTTTLTSMGGYDVYVGKYNSSGALVWAKSFGASTEENATSIDLDATGNVYTTGYFYSATDFNPGTGTYTLTPVGNNDAFISKLDASGNFVWAKKMGGSSFDFGTSLTIDLSGSVIAVGYFQGTGDFDPGSAVYNLTSAGSYDMYVSKSQSTTEILSADVAFGKNIVYPNPATEQITVRGEKIASIEIYSITGQLLKSEITNNTDEVAIPVTELGNGFYFLRIMEGNNSSIVKFVKQ